MRFAVLCSVLLAALNLQGQNRCGTPALWGGHTGESFMPGPGETQQRVTPRDILVIPVVVHVVWHTSSENISDAQIASQIDVLNRDFRADNAEVAGVPTIFGLFVADMEMEFCLVATTRTQTEAAGIGTQIMGGKRRVCYNNLGGHDAIDPAHYLNIWVAARTDGACGDAPLPGQASPAPPDEAGVFIRPDCFGTTGTAAAPYNLGRTTTHEIGHWLNLKHLWGDSLEDLLCLEDDLVLDTPPQAYNYQGECPTHPSISCGTADMFMNFMNYTDDACMAMFSLGQKARAWAAINTFRPELLESSCQPVASAEASDDDTIRLLNNPAAHWTALQLPEKDIFEIAIFDSTGRLVFVKNRVPGGLFYIDTQAFISGIYHIKIRDGGKIHTKKLNIVR